MARRNSDSFTRGMGEPCKTRKTLTACRAFVQADETPTLTELLSSGFHPWLSFCAVRSGVVVTLSCGGKCQDSVRGRTGRLVSLVGRYDLPALPDR